MTSLLSSLFYANFRGQKVYRNIYTYRTIEEANEKVLEGSLSSSVHLDSNFFAREKQWTTFSRSLLFKISQGCEEKTRHVYLFAKSTRVCSLTRVAFLANCKCNFSGPVIYDCSSATIMRLRYRSRSQVIGIGVISLYIFHYN